MSELMEVAKKKVGDIELLLLYGSVVEFRGDCIVNAANEGGIGGFGVDEQINRACGSFEMKEARKKFNGIPSGSAKVTPSFKHDKVKFVIHAVGPVYRYPFAMLKEGEKERSEFLKSKDKLLVKAYESSMERAKENKAESIAFSLLSSGVFRGEKKLEDILQICYDTLLEESNHYDGLKSISLVAYTKEEKEILESIFH